MKLIVGLGNPGLHYARTRHNIGFRCVDRLSQSLRIPLSQRRRYAAVGLGEVEGQSVALAKPRTFMNNSGAAVSTLVHRFTLSPQDLVVVYDDLDLPPGKVRIRPRGSAGGHKGMESIIQALKSQDVPRIRVGIGRPLDGDEVAYVLSPFAPGERGLMDAAIARVADALVCILTQGVEQAMNRYNRE